MGSWSSFSPPSSVGTFSPDTMLLLTDGSVLVHDAYGKNWLRLTPDQTGHWQTGSWSSLLSMTNTRQFFGSGVLGDGRVYAVGGEYSDAGGDTPLGEIFDVGSNTWTALTKPTGFNHIRGDATSCILPDGRVLFGNLNSSSAAGFKTALWDPVTGLWTDAGSGFGSLTSDTKQANCDEETWTLLQDGTVLTVDTNAEPAAERYIPYIDQWVSAGSTPQSLVLTTITDPSHNVVSIFEIGPAILLPNGTLWAIGATGQNAFYTPPPAGSDPQTTPGTWAASVAFPADTTSGHVWPTLTVSDGPAVLLTNGHVLCMAGNLYESSPPDYFSQNATLFELDPNAGTDGALTAFTNPAWGSAPNTWPCRFLLLPSGEILLTTQSSGTIYLYTPDSGEFPPQDSWRPTLTTFPSTLVTGHTHTVTGTQLNGLTQAVSYGDDAQMATNFPLVQMSNGAGDVVYLSTSGFSTRGITPAETQSADFTVPSGLAPGQWQLAVIANGIASDFVNVEVTVQDCSLILDRDTFGEGEIAAMINLSGAPATVNPALYVVVEGYSASDIGLGSDLSNPPHTPSIPDPVPGLSASFSGSVMPEDPTASPSTVQRFTFPFQLQFAGKSVFSGAPENVSISATFSPPGQPSVSGSGELYLIANPDPFILHGDEASGYPWYLSTDLRVFQIAAGATRFGETVATSGSADAVATAFIQGVISNLNGDPAAAGSLFDAIAQDETSTELTLLPTDTTGTPIYNFALARVRLQDVADAKDVGVFFRLWQAQQTNATFDATTTYLSLPGPAGDPVPMLGVAGDEIITIPFFATPRVDTSSAAMTTQTDTPNRQKIAADPLGAERDAYFGCWLDINQPNELRFPDRMVGGNPANLPQGPFTGMGQLQSIQQLIRANHQCLIAEINYAPDPIPGGVDPSNSDKLAQRNLTLVPAPNPGTRGSRLVPQTLAIRPTPAKRPVGVRPDELMIDWGDIPDGSTAELYLPSASAPAILEQAAALYATHRLTLVDPHTIGITAGGVTFVPVPVDAASRLVGLLTVELPAGIRRGQHFTVLVKQLTSVWFEDLVTSDAVNHETLAVAGPASTDAVNHETLAVAGPASTRGRSRAWQRVIGVFRLDVPIGTKASLLGAEEHLLSVMRWIGKGIPAESVWFPVFHRYLLQLGLRVSEMGGDPGKILPSPVGGIAPGRGHHPGGGGSTHGHEPHAGADDHERTGKIEGDVFDRFGDFDGFILIEGRTGEPFRYHTRERGIEELVKRAICERPTVTVLSAQHRPEVPTEVIVW